MHANAWPTRTRRADYDYGTNVHHKLKRKELAYAHLSTSLVTSNGRTATPERKSGAKPLRTVDGAPTRWKPFFDEIRLASKCSA